MTDRTAPALNKLPFLIVAFPLFGVAALIALLSHHPFGLAQNLLLVGSVALGAVLAVLPYILEYKAAVKFAEANQLADAVAQIQQLDQLARQIGAATAQWQDVSSAAGKTAAAARQISDQMATEVENFTEFMKKANDTERNALRLEVDKARRAEGEWLQIVVRILDHIFALHQAASRSGQPELIEQLGHFQNACRDVARRIGLTPYAAEANEPFTSERHKLLEAETAPTGALVGETLAAGYTYQGRLLRPALVKLQASAEAAAAKEEPVVADASPEPTLL